MQEKQEKKECLPETVQAILTVFASAGILMAFAAERYIFAIIAVASMTVLKFCAIKCYNKTLDKFYFVAFGWLTLTLIIMEIMRRS